MSKDWYLCLLILDYQSAFVCAFKSSKFFHILLQYVNYIYLCVFLVVLTYSISFRFIWFSLTARSILCCVVPLFIFCKSAVFWLPCGLTLVFFYQDFGYVQTTSTELLKSYVFNEPIVLDNAHLSPLGPAALFMV